MNISPYKPRRFLILITTLWLIVSGGKSEGTVYVSNLDNVWTQGGIGDIHGLFPGGNPYGTITTGFTTGSGSAFLINSITLEIASVGPSSLWGYLDIQLYQQNGNILLGSFGNPLSNARPTQWPWYTTFVDFSLLASVSLKPITQYSVVLSVATNRPVGVPLLFTSPSTSWIYSTPTDWSMLPTVYGNPSAFMESLVFAVDATPMLGQVVRMPTLTCLETLVLECTNGSAVGVLHTSVQDSNGYPVQVVWAVDGVPYETNNIPPGETLTSSNLTFTADFGSGEHFVVVTAWNGVTNSEPCSTIVTVRDTTPPQIASIVATPNYLWPPDNRMVQVNLNVDAYDNCDPSPVARITQVTCNQRIDRDKPDWIITGPLGVELRAELGWRRERIYTIFVEVNDASGNAATNTVNVAVANPRFHNGH